MNCIPLALSLALLPAAVTAQDWTLLGGQGRLAGDGLFAGSPSQFYDPARPYLAPDGSVQRGRLAEGPTDFGMFTLLPDGRLCLDVGDGSRRCGVYVREGEMRMLLGEGGKRFPFRFELGVTN